MISITPQELEIVRTILRRHVPDRQVKVFGSRARGTARPYSDLDLAIMGAESLPLSTLASLAEDFTESDLPYKVDIVVWADIGESFRRAIRQDAVALDI